MTRSGKSRGLLYAVAALAGLAMLAPRAAVASEPAMQAASAGKLSADQWQPWRDRFVTPEGRVIDNANNDISHSEGQGYGMLLAVMAGDREAFTRIWTFTRNEMLLRDDGLAVWRWDPKTRPHVTDPNNATDGDILIAYALALAGDLWSTPAWTDTARKMAHTIGQVLVRSVGGRTVLMPGFHGFGAADRTDGPVVNLSYWVFEAMPVLERLAPEGRWKALTTSGYDIARRARFGTAKLPTNWISLKATRPVPATGFDPHFGYDAIRIPLYLIRAGNTDPALLGPYSRAWKSSGGVPEVIDLDSGKTVEPMNDPGYRIIAAAVECALNKTPVPADLRKPSSTLYYPATLHLLAISALTQHFPECL